MVFDIVQTGYKNWDGPIFAFVVSLSLYLLLRIFNLLDESKRRRAILLGLCFASVSFIGTFTDYVYHSQKMKNNETLYVEGIVTNFKPMPTGGRSEETFTVSGVSFSFANLPMSGYNVVKYKGGVIKNGLYVKIWYVDNNILRLELVRDSVKK